MDVAGGVFVPGSGWERGALDERLDSESTVVLAFAPSEHDECLAVVDGLAARFPRSLILGCSTAGEIANDCVSDDSVTVAVARFAATRVAAARAVVAAPEQSHAAGRELASLLAEPGLAAVLVVTDGLHVNGSEFVAGLNAALPPGVVVTGGMAGDGPRFLRTWVLDRDGRHERAAVAIGFYGSSLRVGHGFEGGWDIFGPDRMVTRAAGNVLFELDGRPALDLYKEYLGTLAEGLPATGLLFPLAVQEGQGDNRFVRTLLGIDEAARSLTFAGDIPEGSRAQLMKANFDRLVDGAAAAARSTRLRAGDEPPVLSVAIGCVGRRLILGERTDEELEAVLEAMPAGVRQVGFYSYGEFSPWGATAACTLHNQTMTLTTFAESLK